MTNHKVFCAGGFRVIFSMLGSALRRGLGSCHVHRITFNTGYLTILPMSWGISEYPTKGSVVARTGLYFCGVEILSTGEGACLHFLSHFHGSSSYLRSSSFVGLSSFLKSSSSLLGSSSFFRCVSRVFFFAVPPARDRLGI